MNLFSKYLKQQRNETDFMNYFKRIEKRDLETKNTELYPKINSATIKISSYFESEGEYSNIKVLHAGTYRVTLYVEFFTSDYDESSRIYLYICISR